MRIDGTPMCPPSARGGAREVALNIKNQKRALQNQKQKRSRKINKTLNGVTHVSPAKSIDESMTASMPTMVVLFLTKKLAVRQRQGKVQ